MFNISFLDFETKIQKKIGSLILTNYIFSLNSIEDIFTLILHSFPRGYLHKCQFTWRFEASSNDFSLFYNNWYIFSPNNRNKFSILTLLSQTSHSGFEYDLSVTYHPMASVFGFVYLIIQSYLIPPFHFSRVQVYKCKHVLHKEI